MDGTLQSTGKSARRERIASVHPMSPAEVVREVDYLDQVS